MPQLLPGSLAGGHREADKPEGLMMSRGSRFGREEASFLRAGRCRVAGHHDMGSCRKSLLVVTALLQVTGAPPPPAPAAHTSAGAHSCAEQAGLESKGHHRQAESSLQAWDPQPSPAHLSPAQPSTPKSRQGDGWGSLSPHTPSWFRESGQTPWDQGHPVSIAMSVTGSLPGGGCPW